MNDYKAPLLFSLIFLLLLLPSISGCTFIEITPKQPATTLAGQIIFVTVTPAPTLLPDQSTTVASMTPEPPLPPNLELEPPYKRANELGKIMVLEYHRITYPEGRYQRTPKNFRADLRRLFEAGYYPVNFIDLVQGLPDLPAGKKPVVLTFDDSDISQFRLLEDSTVDGDTAVGILLDFHNTHPADWPLRGTFFILGNDTANYVSVFGQPTWAKAKVQFLVEAGMEVGSHTVNHVDLSVATAERIAWELAVSQRVIEDMVPGYTVQSLSVPYGGFPYSLDFLKAGSWEDLRYDYVGNAAAWGGPTISPFDEAFEPYKVTRIEVTDESLDTWLSHFEQNPDDYYVSDGDPTRISYPEAKIATEP